MPLLSVVVPAYQVVEWLEESLRSVQDQSLRDLEVVVVDDGSTDGTGELADRIAAEDPRVRVIHQPNAGLGATRNVGTAAATGELLTFADSAFAGRAYAAYGGVYIAASLAWLWAVEGARPDRWDAIGALVCLAGAALILFGPRAA